MNERWTLLRYEIKNTFIGMRSHWVLCVSSVMTVMISLGLISIFTLLGVHVDQFSSNIAGDLAIHVVLNPEVESPSKIDSIQLKLQDLDNVNIVRYSNKDQELEVMIEEKGEVFSQYRGEENPLANAFYVTVFNEDRIAETTRVIRTIDGVATATYGGQSVVEMIQLLGFFRTFSAILIVLLILLSLYLIYNTIRVTIYSRQVEISIMKSVGATSTFIRVPFELEGVMIGFLGSIVPTVMVWYVYPRIYEQMNGQFLMGAFSLLSPDFIVPFTLLCLPVLGMLIGGCASSYATWRYLKRIR